MAHQLDDLIGGMREHVPPIAGELDRRGQERHARLDGGRQQCHRRFQSFPALRRCSGTARMRPHACDACGEQTAASGLQRRRSPADIGIRIALYMISMLLYQCGRGPDRPRTLRTRCEGGTNCPTNAGLPVAQLPSAGCGIPGSSTTRSTSASARSRHSCAWRNPHAWSSISFHNRSDVDE